MPPRAACLVLASTLALGGGERVLAKLIRTLGPLGFSFRVITLKSAGVVGEALRGEGVELESWDLSDTRDLRILPRLAARIRESEPDLIYIQDHHDCIFWGSLAAAISGFRPVLIPVHSSGQRGASSFRPLNRLLLGLGQVLILLGRWHHKALREEDRLADGPRASIPNPLDAGRFAERRAKAPSDEKNLGTVAALRPEKRHDRLLSLFAELNLRRSVRLSIAGDGPERARLEGIALELGVAERVEFLGAREDVANVLAGMDLFLLTSDVEAQPLSLIEAMASGIPVAAPPHGGIPEILHGGARGLLLQGEDAREWGRQVDAYLSALPKAAQREAVAREVEEEFSEALFSSRYERLFLWTLGAV